MSTPGRHSAEEALALQKAGRVREVVTLGESDAEERLAEMLDGMPEGDWEQASAGDIAHGMIEEGQARFAREEQPQFENLDHLEASMDSLILNSNRARAEHAPEVADRELLRQRKIAAAVVAPFTAETAEVETPAIEDDEAEREPGLYSDERGDVWNWDGTDWAAAEQEEDE